MYEEAFNYIGYPDIREDDSNRFRSICFQFRSDGHNVYFEGIDMDFTGKMDGHLLLISDGVESTYYKKK